MVFYPQPACIPTFRKKVPRSYRRFLANKWAIVASGTTPRLHNLDADIGERTDLAGKHPDIVAKFLELAGKFEAEIAHATSSKFSGFKDSDWK